MKIPVYADDDIMATKELFIRHLIMTGDAVDEEDAEEAFFRGRKEGYIKIVGWSDS